MRKWNCSLLPGSRLHSICVIITMKTMGADRIKHRAGQDDAGGLGAGGPAKVWDTQILIYPNT